MLRKCAKFTFRVLHPQRATLHYGFQHAEKTPEFTNHKAVSLGKAELKSQEGLTPSQA
jgi:hypothetical protein